MNRFFNSYHGRRLFGLIATIMISIPFMDLLTDGPPLVI